jgi:hypothetical protein
MKRSKPFWNASKHRARLSWYAFKNVAIVFSFVVNIVLVSLLLALGPLDFFLKPVVFDPLGVEVAPSLIYRIQSEAVDPHLDELDAAFEGLGEATISTTVQIDEPIPIQFELPLDQPLPLDFPLPIKQDTVVVLTRPVPVTLPAQFNLPGGGGVINGSVSLALPAGLALPIRLDLTVPVSQTIGVRLDVPVNETIPVQMEVPVYIKLGEAGLKDEIEELRRALRPFRGED